jgi:hypothetical protein
MGDHEWLVLALRLRHVAFIPAPLRAPEAGAAAGLETPLMHMILLKNFIQPGRSNRLRGS